MKDLTPEGVALLLSKYGHPVSLSTYEKAVLDNPSAFPKEHKRLIAYKKIPQEVHDAYIADLQKETDAIQTTNPKPQPLGIMAIIDNKDYQQAHNKWWNEYYPKLQEAEKKVHNKHYAKYIGPSNT